MVAMDPHESIEVFAELCAQVDDPFADGAAVLRARNIDETSFALARQTWAARLSMADGDELAARFRRAYSGSGSRGGDGSREPAPAADTKVEEPKAIVSDGGSSELAPVGSAGVRADVPSFMRAASQTREPDPFHAAPPGRHVPSSEPRWNTETGAVDLAAVLKPAVPFDVEARLAPTAPTPAGHRSARPAVRVSTETTAVDVAKLLGKPVPFVKDDGRRAERAEPVAAKVPTASGFGETQAFDIAALVRSAPLPFEAPTERRTRNEPLLKTPVESAMSDRPGTSAPVGRWVRFDPQTGTPLAQPRWEELPPEEKKT